MRGWEGQKSPNTKYCLEQRTGSGSSRGHWARREWQVGGKHQLSMTSSTCSDSPEASPFSLIQLYSVPATDHLCTEKHQHSSQPLLPSQPDAASLWPYCKCMPHTLHSKASLIIQTPADGILCLLSTPQPTSLWPWAPYELEALALAVWVPHRLMAVGRKFLPGSDFLLCCSRHP